MTDCQAWEFWVTQKKEDADNPHYPKESILVMNVWANYFEPAGFDFGGTQLGRIALIDGYLWGGKMTLLILIFVYVRVYIYMQS
jgi:hypothetical protein